MSGNAHAMKTALDPSSLSHLLYFYYRPWAMHLPCTYGVVERIRNMVRSAAMEELEEVDRIFSDLRMVYPSLFEYITSEDDKRAYGVVTCLDQLRTIAYDIEDLVVIKQLNHQEKRGTSPSLSDSIAQMRLSLMEVKAVVEQYNRTAELQSRSFCINPDTFVASSLSSITTDTTASSRYYGAVWSLPDGHTIVGLDSKKKEIIQWILNDHSNQHPKVMSIEGEAGQGKTTLAKMIYHESTSFDLLLWVLAPPLYSDFKEYLVEIICSFTNQSQSYLQRMEVETLKHTLRGILGGRKFLLVLDDYKGVHDDYEGDDKGNLGWGRLMEMFEVGLAGSTVILVSANYVYEASMRWKLQGLSESESWSLFARSAGFDEEAEKDCPSYVSEIGRSLVYSCDGCPLAIKTLGSMLRYNRDEQSWNQIKERMIWNRATLYRRDTAACNAFNASAEKMSAGLLPCLYVSSILSKSKVMPKDQLIFSWMALGLLQSSDGNEDCIAIGNRYCDELVQRCCFQLFQSDGRPMVLLHQSVASLQGSLGDVKFLPSRMPIPEDCRYLIWTGGESPNDQALAQNLSIPAVRTFRFEKYVGPVSKSFLEELISKLCHLRVLFLDGSIFENLPETIGSLKLLRHLSLAGNGGLKTLPDSICNLRRLQTLDLSGCEQLQTLPQNMDELVSLRHLFVSINPTNIKELTLLHHLKICSSPSLGSLSEEISHLTTLKVLQIHDCPSIASLPKSIESLTSLTELSILNCEMLDLTNWDGLQGLTSLQYLQIQGLPKLIKFRKGLESAAQSLGHLVVRNCQNLIELPDDLQKCIKLVEMVIDSCSNLATLPEGIHDLQVKIINCPNLIARWQSGVGDAKSQQLRHPVDQKRAIPALDDYPGFLSCKSKRVEYSEAGQQASHNVPGTQVILSVKKSEVKPEHEEVLREDTVMEELKDLGFIFFLLPEDYEIEKDTLIQLWMAAECINDELRGEECFKFFFLFGYLLPCGINSMTGKDRYRINTQMIDELVVNQKGNAIASSYLRWNKECQNNPLHAESIHHVSLGSGAEIDAETFRTLENFKQLRTLLFLANHGTKVIQMPRQLFSVFSKLEALDLSRTHLKEVPSSIGHMIQLRYLDLSWTLIEWLPNILCSLVQLQTLKLRGCYNLTVLPEKLHELTKLRHLDVDVLGQLDVMPPKIGELVNLRTLPAFLVGTEDGRKIQELNKLNYLSGELCIANLDNVVNDKEAEDANLIKKEKLRKIELRWTSSEICGTHNNSLAILRWLKPSTNLEELHISCYEGESFPGWIGNRVYCNIVSIVFYRCEYLSNVPLVEQLQNLKHLHLVRMNRVKEIKEKRGHDFVAFPKLEKLEINEMQGLENWDWKNSNEGDFGSLTHLIIEDCPKLDGFDVLQHLPSLKYFEIRKCPKLETLSDRKLPQSLQELIVDDCPQIQKKCVEGGEDWHKIKHVPNKSI